MAAVPSRLRKMFFGTRPADWDIRVALESCRAQARYLYENNSYAKRAVSLMVDNILGSDGILYRATAKDPNGKYDKYANKLLSDEFNNWAKQADIAEQCSYHDIQRIALTSAVIDGECFIRIIKNPNYRDGLKLQILESEYVDHQYNVVNQNIRMGIQYDDFGKVLGYWIWSEQPNNYWQRLTKKRIFFPADEIIHVYLKERSSGNRGISWLAPVMKSLEDIGRYQDAELEAALNGAINIGVLEKQQNGIEITGDAPTDSDDDGVIVNNSENLTVFEAPTGYKLSKYENGHPNNQYPAYIKAALRSVAAGLNISYNDLANDYESVNYSSLRQSALICRDRWQTLQTWYRETVCEDVFDVWLPMALVSGNINLPYVKIEKWKMHKFVVRTWDWVDPQKDITSTILALQSGLTTFTRAADELGLDFAELCAERANDESIMKAFNLSFNLSKTIMQNNNQPANSGEQ
jgi:lambda family phage portal protein